MQDAATATETQALILTQAQAEAVYSAMCALNNVGGLLSAHIRTDTGHFIEVHEDEMGIRMVAAEVHLPPTEVFPNQSAFATAYSLQQG